MDDRKCSRCKIEEKDSRIAHNGYCILCSREYAKIWRAKNKDKVQKYNKDSRIKNPENGTRCTKDWISRNKDRVKAKTRERYVRNIEQNRAKAIAHRKTINKEYLRRVAKEYFCKNKHKKYHWNRTRKYRLLQATPKWLSKEELNKIEILYEKARWLESITGLRYDVDHVIPINGKNVCGFHVWENLQILEKSLNYIKSNKY